MSSLVITNRSMFYNTVTCSKCSVYREMHTACNQAVMSVTNQINLKSIINVVYELYRWIYVYMLTTIKQLVKIQQVPPTYYSTPTYAGGWGSMLISAGVCRACGDLQMWLWSIIRPGCKAFQIFTSSSSCRAPHSCGPSRECHPLHLLLSHRAAA